MTLDQEKSTATLVTGECPPSRTRTFVVPLAALLLCVLIGSGYRAVALQQHFSYAKEAVGYTFSMASRYFTTPGLFSWDEYMMSRETPDEYGYTRGGSTKYRYDSPSRSEIGWPFILRIILPDNIKGINNVAIEIARWQHMIELAVIIVLFLCGMRIAGIYGAIAAGLAYATFLQPMVLASDVGYYYWTIPLSAGSIYFLVRIYREDFLNTEKRKRVAFLLYGIYIGFASFIRLYFIYLPIFLAPLVALRERSIKKAAVLLMLALLGQGVFLAPLAVYNNVHFGRLAVTTRPFWPILFMGLGFYDNPWGITDTGEITLNKWAKAQGAPDMFAEFEASEVWFKKRFFEMLREHPEVYLRNFVRNFHGGLTVSPSNFSFEGLAPLNSRGARTIVVAYPFLVLFALILLYRKSRQAFWAYALTAWQGFYLILIITMWFANYIPFLAAYIPVFVFCLGIGLAVIFQVGCELLSKRLRPLGNVWLTTRDVDRT